MKRHMLEHKAVGFMGMFRRELSRAILSPDVDLLLQLIELPYEVFCFDGHYFFDKMRKFAGA